jgi:hypothetical protein
MASTRPARPKLARPRTLILGLLLAGLLWPGAAAPSAYDKLFLPSAGIAALASSTSPRLGLAELEILALEASGLPEAAIPAYAARLEQIYKELAARLSALGETTEAGKAEASLGFLHERLFKRYLSDATTVDGVLDTGAFNCVSSAVVYLLALRSVGLAAEGVRTTDHAFCIVHTEGRDIDVETTNPYGFDPGSRKEFGDAFGKATGYRYVPPGNYAERQTIGERELLALIISNRIALLEERRDFVAALALSADFAQLAEGQEGRKLVVDCVNNLGSSLSQKRDYAGMEALAKAAQAALGKEARLGALLSAGVYNRLLSTLSGPDWRSRIAEADTALAAGDLDRRSWSNLVVFAYGNAAQVLGQGGDWLGAARLAEEGLARLPGDPNLTRTAATCRQNYVVLVHNRFAGLYNKADYRGAAAVIEEGLSNLPGDQRLLEDRAAAAAAIKR